MAYRRRFLLREESNDGVRIQLKQADGRVQVVSDHGLGSLAGRAGVDSNDEMKTIS